MVIGMLEGFTGEVAELHADVEEAFFSLGGVGDGDEDVDVAVVPTGEVVGFLDEFFVEVCHCFVVFVVPAVQFDWQLTLCRGIFINFVMSEKINDIMNQIESLCIALSRELSAMPCPDCGKCHRVEVSHLVGESTLSSSFPTLLVGPDTEAFACRMFLSKIHARVSEARRDLMSRNGLL